MRCFGLWWHHSSFGTDARRRHSASAALPLPGLHAVLLLLASEAMASTTVASAAEVRQESLPKVLAVGTEATPQGAIQVRRETMPPTRQQ